jgi:hypothetical protein
MLGVMHQVVVDRSFQRPPVLERAAPNPSRGDLREEVLDLIQPTGARRREV